jgi:hypothetical protein
MEIARLVPVSILGVELRLTYPKPILGKRADA